jgi:hypothetical protein
VKKIISFSVWGDKHLYTQGAIINARMREEFYPDWIARFYYDESVPVAVINELESISGTELVKMPRAVDCLGLYWRFHPMFDDANIERFIVRDTDSQFTKREVACVDEWVESKEPFHIIRDCESHNVCILGGTWGAVAGCIPGFQEMLQAWYTQLNPCYQNPRGLFHGSDQIFLERFIWPIIKNHHCAHDERFVYTGKERPFTVPKENGHYVGMVC